METKRLLVQQCGQARTLIHTLIWKQKFLNQLKDEFKQRGYNLEIDWKYDLWNKENDSQVDSLGQTGRLVDQKSIEQEIKKYHNADIMFYDYNHVDVEYNKVIGLHKHLSDEFRPYYHRYFSQTICRGLAFDRLEQSGKEYDYILLCRPDHIFFNNDNIKQFALSLLKNNALRASSDGMTDEYFIYTDFVEYTCKGINTSDQTLWCISKGLLALYYNWKINLYNYVIDYAEYYSDASSISDSLNPHHICAGFIHNKYIINQYGKIKSQKFNLPKQMFPVIKEDDSLGGAFAILRPWSTEFAKEINASNAKMIYKQWKTTLANPNYRNTN